MIKNLSIILLAFAFLACAAKTQSRSFGQIVDDSFTAIQLKSKFIRDDSIPAKNISIKVQQGVVTLTGELDNETAINRAIEVAEMQKGVKEVKAYLVLKEFGHLKKTEPKPGFLKTLFSKNRSGGTRSQKTSLGETDLLEEESVRDNDLE